MSQERGVVAVGRTLYEIQGVYEQLAAEFFVVCLLQPICLDELLELQQCRTREDDEGRGDKENEFITKNTCQRRRSNLTSRSTVITSGNPRLQGRSEKTSPVMIGRPHQRVTQAIGILAEQHAKKLREHLHARSSRMTSSGMPECEASRKFNIDFVFVPNHPRQISQVGHTDFLGGSSMTTFRKRHVTDVVTIASVRLCLNYEA